MKLGIVRFAVVGAAAAAALTVGLTSAVAAAPTYTIAAGTAPTGTTVAVKGTTTGTSPQVHFTDTTAGLPLTCATSAVSGTTKTGVKTTGLKLATITATKAAFTSCKGPFNLAFVVTGKLSWYINATGLTKTGVTPASITSVSAHVADGTSCVFDVTGSVAGTYKNGTSTAASQLILPGTVAGLTISNVTGSLCGLAGIQTGDKASFKGTYALKATTTAYNPVTIKAA